MKRLNMPIVILIGIALGTLLFPACSTRPLPESQLITLYNSDLQTISKLSPMDTIYIKIVGLSENSYYSVTVEDPDGNAISTIETETDEAGVINPTPLWYDVGLKRPDATHDHPYLAEHSDLDLTAFRIRVKSLPPNEGRTNFYQNLFFITNDFSTASKPKPIVTACYKPDASGSECVPENAFEETGTRTADGTISPKTNVYVQAERIPWFVNDAEVTSVNIYIVPFDGDVLAADEDIATPAIASLTNVGVTSSDNVTKKLSPTLIWDLSTTTLINPDAFNCTYRVIVDVNRDGKFNYGIDVDADGKTDEYIDGIDGNSVPGFIVQDTPANEIFVTIKDGKTDDANKVNILHERPVQKNEELFFFMDNIPTSNTTVQIYVVNTTSKPANLSPLTDIRNKIFTVDVSFPDENDIRFMPFIDGVKLIDTFTNLSVYTYDQDISSDMICSIIIDINSDGIFDSTGSDSDDIFLSDATTVKGFVTILAQPSGAETYADGDQLVQTRIFDETGTENGNTTVWVGVTGVSSVAMYVFEKKNWVNGEQYSDALVTQTQTANGTYALWNLNDSPKVINPGSDGLYDVVIDFSAPGTYDESSDFVKTISIRDTIANSLPRLQYTNIASGGNIGRNSPGYYDYRDVFNADGTGTKNNWYVKKGIKAIWNPYIKRWGSRQGGYDESSQTLYYGASVDVYIVNAQTFNLYNWDVDNTLTDSIDVTGRHKTMPVQTSCSNGAGQQNIWTPTMAAGSYYVIVDVNRNHRIDEGIDIIDAVNENGTTIESNPNVVGFSVTN